MRVADGTRLAYSLRGPEDGPVAVLCDGISCDGFAWRYLAPHIETHFRVLHMHWRGHGRSGIPRDPGRVRVPHLTGDLDEMMGRLGLGPAIFFGHSMGVQVVLEMAWRHPDRVRASVLLSGAAGRLLDTFKDTDLGMRILPRLSALAERHRDGVARAMRTLMPTELGYFFASYAEINRALVRREDFMPYLEHLATMSPSLFLRMLTDAAERTSRDFLWRLRVPMLVIAGGHDGFTPPRLGRELAQRLPRGEFALLPAGSHTAPIELPHEVEVLVDDFILRHKLGELSKPPEGARACLAARFRDARGASVDVDP